MVEISEAVLKTRAFIEKCNKAKYENKYCLCLIEVYNKI
jgi:hypothetical protein